MDFLAIQFSSLKKYIAELTLAVLPPSVAADVRRLEEPLVEYVENAVALGPGHGQLDARSHRSQRQSCDRGESEREGRWC